MANRQILLEEVERAAVRGWPAAETASIDGWLARATSGGSIRANTVAALRYTGGDVGLSIAAVVEFYRARRAVPRFTIAGSSQPAGLDDALGTRGWRRTGEHVTMIKTVAAMPGPPPADVENVDGPRPDWLDVYLAGLSPDRRGVAPEILARIPQPRRLFLVRQAGSAVATGLSVIDGKLASVQCMSTRPEARRTGAATRVLAAIEAAAAAEGVKFLYLQTEEKNSPARALYERMGFAVADRYHVRELVS